ncbi:hypothetical protein EZJ43_16270 [Pedobacter changchengzhani]|uniref:DUF4149 domain-containing protein n=1 Tax=Pedobacter changchengzhani TaxID=2529274 RepID=A0A4R5MHG3_9SPHI|nr:hypothetical protein [Pedobacter changchengzhani]TDG34911.1 hypothetical protein EZJ43_16270 [Pedobacter changchengzhani]
MKKYIAIFCIIFWAGLIAGISFLEAPLKFQAPGITIPLGLGIGQLVFQALNKVEIFLWIVILICTYPSSLKTIKGLFLLIITISILVDSIWLLPLLDERAKLVLSGNNPPESFHHILYAVIEAIKIILLATLGFLKLKDLHDEK